MGATDSRDTAESPRPTRVRRPVDPDRLRGLPALAARRTLADDAADAIREQILGGRFRRGEHLAEARIARQLNVSRGPIREAFKLLRAEGLVEEETNRGTFVVVLSGKDVRDIYDLRAAIEARAARRVAQDRSPGALEELGRCLARLAGATHDGDLAEVARADLAFHETICRVSGNARLHSVFLRHVPALRTLIRLDEHLYRSLDVIADQHRAILDAIATGDPDRASNVAARHCDEAAELIAGYLDSLVAP